LNRIFVKNSADEGDTKPIFYFFLYEKLQSNYKDIIKKIVDELNIFFKTYFQLKSRTDKLPLWREFRSISVNNFETVVIRLKEFKALDDTGFICFKLMSECLCEIEENSADYIEKTVRQIFLIE
jgi:hypothetical protein